jgi:uncharacterized membrane protein YeiH
MMSIKPLIYVLEHFGVAVCAIAGVLAARGRGVDLFGVTVLALVTAFGGGTIRDLCLGATPVFWIQNPDYVLTALAAALATFVLARWFELPQSLLEYSDAVGLAMFTIIGAQKSISLGADGITAVALGTITGVAGGIIRDVLLNELPLVFRKEIRLYATAAVAGATVFVIVRLVFKQPVTGTLAGAATTLLLRLAAIRWRLALPEFRTKQCKTP